MDLGRYLAILNRRKWIIVFTAAMTLAVILIGAYLVTPTYGASTVLRVHGSEADYANLNYMDRLMRTYVELVTSTSFAGDIAHGLDLPLEPVELAAMIDAGIVGATQLIEIKAESADPVQAAAIVNLAAQLLIERETTEGRIAVVETAAVPVEPAKPRMFLSLLLGLALGLAGGLGLALLLENLDHSIHSVQELAAAVPLPLLGSIPGFRRSPRAVPAAVRAHAEAGRSADRAAIAAFDALGVSVVSMAQAAHMRTLLVTSAEARAGRTTVAANLAWGITRAGTTVILVDGDLLNPALHTMLGLRREPGLREAVADPGRLGTVLQRTEVAGLRLLAAGLPCADPPAVLTMAGMTPLLERLSGQADIVIWDSGPLLAAADSAVLAHLVDGVLLVASRDQATVEHLDQALHQLDLVGAHVLGVVFNRASRDQTRIAPPGNAVARLSEGDLELCGAAHPRVEGPVLPRTAAE